MNVALQIKKSMGVKTDLKTIKKVISLYEKIINNNDDYVSVDQAIADLDESLGEVTVAERIKAFRSREGITQKDLAAKADIKQQHLSEIERGLRTVGVTTAKKLADALNCNYRSLL